MGKEIELLSLILGCKIYCRRSLHAQCHSTVVKPHLGNVGDHMQNFCSAHTSPPPPQAAAAPCTI